VYADLLYSSRASSTIATVNTEYEAAINAVSGGRRREFSLHDRRRERRSPSRQRCSRRKTPGPYKEDSSDIRYFHTTYGDKARKCTGCRRELNSLGGGMIFLQDDKRKQQFMVDTGAICSVLPHRTQAKPTGPPLSGTDGKDIPSWGRIRRSLTFGLRIFCHLFARCRLQTHTRIRLLVRPRAAG
jgi:hypothetical protein